MIETVTRPTPVAREHWTRSMRLEAWGWATPFHDSIRVSSFAPPMVVMKAFMEVAPREMPLATCLGRLRYLPARWAGGEVARRAELDPDRPFVKSLISGLGTRLLEASEDELVFGTVGKLHQIKDQEPVPLHSPSDFMSFREPGHEKLLMSFRVIPGRSGGTLMIFEHSTMPTDEDSYRRFARYWRVIRPAGALVTRQLLWATARRAERDLR